MRRDEVTKRGEEEEARSVQEQWMRRRLRYWSRCRTRRRRGRKKKRRL